MSTDNTCNWCDQDGEYLADNNMLRVMELYCPDCEERRSDRYGCAMILAQGCGCVPGGEDCACGCGGTGVYA